MRRRNDHVDCVRLIETQHSMLEHVPNLAQESLSFLYVMCIHLNEVEV